MWYFFFLNVIGFCVFYNYNINKRIGYPPFLYSGVWFLVVLFHFISVQFNLIDIYELSPETLFVFTLGVLIFTLGGRVVKIRMDAKPLKDEIRTFEFTKNSDVFLIIISLVFLPFFIINSYHLAVEYMIFDSLYTGIRNSAVQEQDIGFSKYGIDFAYVSFFVQFYNYIINKNNKMKLGISIFILLTFCILTAGRTFFITFFCLIFGVLIILKKLKIRYIIYGLAGFLFLFSLIGILLSKGGNTDSSFEENLSSISESFMVYFIGGLSAFDSFLNSNYLNTYGENSFRFFTAFLNKMGLSDSSPVKLVDEYVSVPFETNVYTIYKIYFQDFGILFMIFTIFLISSLHTFFYYKAIREKKIIYTFFYSIMLHPLLMSFFQEQYLSLIPTWFYLSVIFFTFNTYFNERVISSNVGYFR